MARKTIRIAIKVKNRKTEQKSKTTNGKTLNYTHHAVLKEDKAIGMPKKLTRKENRDKHRRTA